MQYKLENPVRATIGTGKYQCSIEWRNGKFIADEPVTSGGKDMGPDPFTLLLSSLASCTLVTMRMYIDRKGWDIPEIVVNANMYKETKEAGPDDPVGRGKITTIIDRDIIFLSPVEAEQKQRLLEIANHCPISKILEGDIKVRTFLFKDSETEKKINYANDEITVVWKPEFCQHAARCWKQLPEVFDYKKKAWINPHGAASERIIEQVKKCPSGALSFFYNNETANGSRI
ncbi:MAG: (4Fe-4S)-binding protein [Daejeonella sp.]